MFPRPRRFVLLTCLLLLWSQPSRGGRPPSTADKARRPTAKALTDLNGDPLPAGALARLGSARLRQNDCLSAITFSADGKTLAASGERCLYLYDTATGKQRRVLPDSDPGLLAFAPQGGVLAVANGSRVDLWDTDTGKLLRRFQADPRQVYALAFSPDGRLLATGGGFFDEVLEEGKTTAVRLWDTTTGREVRQFEGHNTSITAVGFSADGKRLYSSNPDRSFSKFGNDRTIAGAFRIWDVATGKLLQRSAARPHLVLSVNGRTAAYAHQEKGVQLADAATQRKRAAVVGGGASFTLSADGGVLATLDVFEPLRLWDAESGRELRQLEAQIRHECYAMAFSADGRLLAVAGAVDEYMRDSAIRIWDVATGWELRPGGGHCAEVTCLAYAPNGKVLASASADNSVRLWQPATGKELYVLKGHQARVTALAFSPDGATLASGGADETVSLWETATGKQGKRLTAGKGGTLALTFALDGKSLLVCDADGTVRSWDVGRGKVEELFRCSEEELQQAVFAPDGRALAVVVRSRAGPFSSYSKIHVWRIPLGKELLPLDLGTRPDHLPDCCDITFSPDGRLLAISESRVVRGQVVFTIRVREVASGRQALTLDGGNVTSRSLAISADGRMVAHGSGQAVKHPIDTGDSLVFGGIGTQDNVLLRDISAGRDLVLPAEGGKGPPPLHGHLGSVSCLAFAPDGKTVATGGADSTVLVWDVSRFARRIPKKAATLSARDLEQMWKGLAGADVPSAYQAIAKLGDAPAQAVPFLRGRLRPVAEVDAQQVRRLLAELDDKQFAVRDRASGELARLGDAVAGVLRRTLEEPGSLEYRRRVQTLLNRLDGTGLPVEQLRAVTVLERAGTAEARELLQALAGGAPGARLTSEAAGALQRLSRLTGKE